MPFYERSNFEFLNHFFDTRNDEIVVLTFAEMEAAKGKKMPTVAKSKTSVDTVWNNYSHTSVIWKKHGLFIKSVDIKKGQITFEKDEELFSKYKEEIKSNKNRDKLLNDPDFIKFLKNASFNVVLAAIFAFLIYSCNDSDPQKSKYCKKVNSNLSEYSLRDIAQCDAMYEAYNKK
jgi:hypothetical protein